MRVVGAVLALLLSAAPAAAQPAGGTAGLIQQLEQNRIVRLPGAVPAMDDTRVLAGLPPTDRVLLSPAGARTDLDALQAWARRSDARLTVVEGAWIARLGGADAVSPLATATPGTLRYVFAYGDVTDIVLGEPVPEPVVVAATPAQLDHVPVTQPRAGVQLVTLPTMAPGAPYIDYAPGLADRFPGELVIVARGQWLDVAGPGAREAARARDAAYGPLVLSRRPQADVVAVVLDRTAQRPVRPVFAPPAPALFAGTGDMLAVIALALVLPAIAGLSIHRHRRRSARRRELADAMRPARALAYLRMEELGAWLLDVERDGRAVDPRVAERHATSRALFDQALTPEAMRVVMEIAEEGLAMTGGGRLR